MASSLGGYNSGDDDEIDESNEVSNLFDRRRKSTSINASLKNQLKSTVSASKDVLKKIKNQIFCVSQEPNKLCHFGLGKMLSPTEQVFYIENSSVQKILRNLKRHVDASPDFKIFPDELLSEEQKAGTYFIRIVYYCFKHLSHCKLDMDKRKAEREMKHADDAKRIASMLGSRSSTDYYNSGNPLTENVMSHIIPSRPTEKCKVFGCDETMKYICKKANCRLVICQIHGQAHSKHQGLELKENTSVEVPDIGNRTATITDIPIPAGSTNVQSNHAINCEVSECQGDVRFTCENEACGIKVCEMHGPNHTQHSSQYIKAIKRPKH